MNVLETEKLYHLYGGSDTPAMDGVDIKIKKGVKTVLLGANGAGKSTLFYHLNGIMKPMGGKVLAFGEPVGYRRKALMKLRSRIAVVLQNPDDQIFGQTVESDVRYGPANLRLPDNEVDRRVERALFLTGLDDLRDRNTMQLSYGQRKRLTLAGALAMKPEVLIMDEPTAGLDPQMSLELRELADQLHDGGTTVVLSTHDVDLAYAWADELHVLRRGKLIYSGTSEGFFSDDEQVYLSGLTQPTMYALNHSMSCAGQIQELPYPRTDSEMVSKIASGPRGDMTIIPVGESIDAASVSERIGNAPAGVYGAICRETVAHSGMTADFMFNGLESCIGECLKGRDSVLLCEKDSIALASSKLDRMKEFGPGIAYRIEE